MPCMADNTLTTQNMRMEPTHRRAKSRPLPVLLSLDSHCCAHWLLLDCCLVVVLFGVVLFDASFGSQFSPCALVAVFVAWRATESGTAPYLILSLDAGGLRGIFIIHLLRKLQEAYPGFLENVHLVAGASSGSPTNKYCALFWLHYVLRVWPQ